MNKKLSDVKLIILSHTHGHRFLSIYQFRLPLDLQMTFSLTLHLSSRLHSNNLLCDCHVAWLSDWLRQRPRLGLYTQCMAPPSLRGHNIAEVQKKEFMCTGKFVCVLFVWFVYRR